MLYPDIAARAGDVPPSVIEDEARSWIAPLTPRWTPDTTEPSDVLAVMGALMLSAARHQPLAWDGETLRGPDPIPMLARLRYREAPVKDRSRMHIGSDDGEIVLSLPVHEATRTWAGQINAERIWTTNQDALYALCTWADELRERAGPDEPPPVTITMGTALDPRTIGWRARKVYKPSVTGYDIRVVGDSIRDGFRLAAHDDIELVGARPAVEIYSMIGAAYVESQGRWPTPSRPSIPPIASAVLRDRYDLDRHMLHCADELPVVYEMLGRRGALRAA